ncbi:MAG TPA: SRPBCC family protein [Kofleriaceae bacterium]|nr:SRPBCC family protein [Kofleriaceae bacterium]
MSKLASFPGGLLLGAGLMYFLDPIRGRGRRRRINEVVMHAQRLERDLLGKAARDAKHRVSGIVERVKHPGAADVTDEVIEQRARARIGHAVSHPRALDVVVVRGRLILLGPILEGEAAQVLRCAKSTPGVLEVVDRMERHATAANIPSLQGPGRRRRQAKGTWPPAMQASATGAGALLMAYGLLLRRGLVGALFGAAGGALALRGSLNRPIPDLVSGRSGVTVQKSIIVKKPIHTVFDLWSRLDNFPLFMQHVQEVDVQIGGKRSRWTVDGPAGTKVEFEAETTELEPDRVLAWRTLPNQKVEHHGIVRFSEVEGGTRVAVQMTYRPPGGIVGHAIAHILGWDPKARMDDDLVRMKALLEEGRTRAHRQTVELADLH